MKKTIIALAFITGLVAACTPKVSKTPPPPPVAEAAAPTGSAAAGGLIIASSKCTKCHKDKTEHVPKHTFAEQQKLMETMAKKAKLSEQETLDLMSYVKAQAKA